jgi:uncharacterized protein (UPF0261 family)
MTSTACWAIVAGDDVKHAGSFGQPRDAIGITTFGSTNPSFGIVARITRATWKVRVMPLRHAGVSMAQVRGDKSCAEKRLQY